MTTVWGRAEWGRALLLVLATALVYAPLRHAGFVWDDDAYVWRNPNLGSLDGLARIWLEPRSIPQYYPLVHTTYWIEARLWGLAPARFHATNVALHALASVLLWRVLVRLALPGAFFAAALFAVHPVMVESVAWITERKNVLSMGLALASLAAYLRFDPLAAPAPGGRRPLAPWALALALYVAALLAKSVVCSLPAVVLVLAWWRRGRIERRDVVPLLPFFAVGLAAAAATVWLERHHVGALGNEWSLAPIERVLVAGRALVFYAGKLLWPHPLIFFYPRWEISAAEAWQLAFPFAVGLLAIGLWAARARLGRGPLAVLLVYAGVLFPALGFFDVYPFRYAWVADHFQYHASAAAFTGFAALCAAGFARAGPRLRPACVVAAASLLAVLGVLGWRQTHVYRDLETLYRDTIAKNASAWSAYLNLANHLSSQGRNAEALPLAREAVRLRPALADAHNTLGAVLFLDSVARGAPDAPDARAAFAEALRLDPTHVDALYNAAAAASAAARHDEAAALYARIVVLDGAASEARLGQARALLAAGRRDAAADVLREALRRDPRQREAAALLGSLGPPP